ncbi:MAG: hypothetical protein C5B47_05160, partial [Verrucomicrobia bacterium]
MLFPKNLQLISQELAIAWNDGTESYIALEALRRACPCAVCQGEPDALGRTPNLAPKPLGPASFELSRWELVGNYGLQPHWKDGHSSGIFAWGRLRD